jgi:LacI family transcriptional regulator
MGVDIKQLAAGLGVSASTVSRALNGYTDIKAETRERIVKRANELNYHPNLRAQRLAKGRADAVGIVYPFDNGYVGNPKFLEMISAFSARLESSGIDLLLAAAGDASEMATYGRLVRGGRVDAILLADTKVVDSRIDFLQEASIPFLCYGRSGARNDFAWYDFDNEAGSRLAVERLAALGHKFIPSTLNKLQQVRARIDAHMAAGGQPIWLEVDGGVKADNIGEIVRAGADTCVAGSAVFGAPDVGGGYKGIMQTLRKNAAA